MRNKGLKALVSAALVAGSLAIAVPAAQAVTPGYIDTFAGNGVAAGPSDATDLGFTPSGLVADDGALYVSDQKYSVVRKVDATGAQVIVAGTGTAGYDGDGVAATTTPLYSPDALAVDVAGNLFIADQYNHRVRVVPAVSGSLFGQAMTAGNIYTVAGTGSMSYSGDGGPATAAALSYPRGLALDADGNLFITTDQRVRVVAATAGTRFGQAMTAGNIYTVAGTGVYGDPAVDGVLATTTPLFNPAGVLLDGDGNVLVADQTHNRVRVVAATAGTFYGQAMAAGYIATIVGTGDGWNTGDGGPATAAGVSGPVGLAFDATSNLVITSAWGHRVRMVAAADATVFGQAMTAGSIYTIAGTGEAGFSGDGALATAAQVFEPGAATVDGSGNVVFTDETNLRVRLVARSSGSFYGHSATASSIVTVAGNGTDSSGGDGGLPTAAQLYEPEGVVVDGAGNLIFGDSNGRVWFVAAVTGSYYGRSVTAGSIYAIAGTAANGDEGDGVPASTALLSSPTAVALDGAGNLFIGDFNSYRVRVVAAADGEVFGQTVTAGNIYTVAGTGTSGFNGDGILATTAELAEPQGVAVDGDGNLVLTDTWNARVRVVAATTGTFYGQEMTAGYIYTIAGTGTVGFGGDGGPATAAQLDYPDGLAVDGDGNVVVADETNHRVRIIAASSGTFYGRTMTAGYIDTIVGSGVEGYDGDGGPATVAELDYPSGVALDGGGNLYVADSGNDVVRMVAAATGTVNGRSVTGGHIYTVAGTGTRGFSGDGGPATDAQMDSPTDVALNAAGDLFIADGDNHRVRVVYAPPTPATASSAPTMGTPTIGSQTVTLSWTAPTSDGGRPIQEYQVYLATTPGGQDYEGSAAAQVWAPSTGTTISGLVNGTTYYFTVLAWNDVDYSAPSNEVSATPTGTVPDAPAMYAPVASSQTVDLAWDAPSSDGGSPIDEYRVYQGTTAGGEDYSTPVAIVDPWNDWTTISGLTNGTTYYFTVKAHNLYGLSLPSGEVSATPMPEVPGAPTDLTLTAVGDGSITLDWTAPTSDGGATIDEYRIYQDGTLIATIGATATDATVSGLLNGDAFTYTVRAHNSAGESPSSNSLWAIAGPPTAPTSLTSTSGRGSATLWWTDHGSLITSHEVTVYAYQRATRRAPAQYTLVQTLTTAETSISVSNLPGGKTRYVFRVSATNAAGTSPVSDDSGSFGIKGGPL
jgi:sugar lactone lactonase YvrE